MKEAQQIPPTEIHTPDQKKVEIRLIVWRGKNVPGYRGGSRNDAFVHFFIDGDETGQTWDTDTHFLCKKHNPCWNWRIKMWIDLPIKSRAQGRIRMQVIEWDLFGAGEVLGEASIELYDWLLMAYHRPGGGEVKPFLEEEQARQKVLAKGFFGDNANEEDDDEDDEGDDDAAEDENNEGNDEDDDDDDDNDDGQNQDTQPLLATPAPVAVAVAPEDDEENKEEEDIKKPGELPEVGLVDQIMSFLGIGDVIAQDGKWVPIFKHDQVTKRDKAAGHIAISVAIVNEQDATLKPVGDARNSPNENPYLPYPPGRFNFLDLLNPLNLIREICGESGKC